MACLGAIDERLWKLRIRMIALFTFLFATFVALLTNARRSEFFGATAAYAAILVVYVSAGVGSGACATGFSTQDVGGCPRPRKMLYDECFCNTQTIFES
ncbi:hypothetical protein K458DRAFT_183247 [Lentithecium fluviatile CBS 122367]|uniref:DUF6594 domain-containing protein n=1 Tax=Lentithecium fluviatile CBS 122367 TaxID=1168545 RepID=A0A6G1IEC7_9PLEO|nr:hypothetical protein K458DRAFT_183247 [Lentithecium fluviatile CBS 122367]